MEDTRVRALQAALELFTSQGYDRTSLREIADELGITKAALYYHFPTKDTILVTLLQPFLNRVDGLLAEVEAMPRGEERARRLLASYLDVMVDERAIIALLSGDTTTTRNPEIGERLIDHQNRLRDVLVGSRRSTKARVYAACALGTLQGGVVGYANDDLSSVREYILEAAFTVLSVGG